MNDFSCSVAIQQSVAQSMMKGNHVVILVDFKEKEAFGVLNFERKEDFNLSYIHHANLKTFGLPIGDSRKIEMAPLALLGDNVRSII